MEKLYEAATTVEVFTFERYVVEEVDLYQTKLSLHKAANPLLMKLELLKAYKCCL